MLHAKCRSVCYTSLTLSSGFFSAVPQVEPEMREHSVDKGETLKVKIPYSGTGPFEFKLKKNNREVPDSDDRVKVIPMEDYVILQIRGYCVHQWTTLYA